MAKTAEKRNSTGSAAERQGPGLRPLATAVQPLARKALGQRNLAEGGLIVQWPEIVGEEVAGVSLPRKLSFPKRSERRRATLTLRVESGHALALQHQIPQLIERINAYFGYAAVAEIRFQQGPVRRPSRADRKAPRRLTPQEEQSIKERVSGVRESRLRDALARLGRDLLKRR